MRDNEDLDRLIEQSIAGRVAWGVTLHNAEKFYKILEK